MKCVRSPTHVCAMKLTADMKKIFTILVTLCMAAFSWAGSITFEGYGTNGYVPFSAGYADEYGTKSQFIYLLDDPTIAMLAGKTITGITFYATANLTFGSNPPGITIRLAEVTNSEVSGFLSADFTTVFSDRVPTGSQEMVCNFVTQFTYTGEGNLLVEVEVTTAGGYQTVSFYAESQTSGAYYMNGSGNSGGVNYVPKATFTGEGIGVGTMTDQLADGYYLVGTHNNWLPTADDLFAVNGAVADEYMLNTALTEGNELKVVQVSDNETVRWFPDGDNIIVDEAHAGPVTIYFRPTYNAEWSDVGGYMYIIAEATDPQDAIYSVIGTSNLLGAEWDYADIRTEMHMDGGAFTYVIDSVTLTPEGDYQYKVVTNHTVNVQEWPSVVEDDNYHLTVTESGVYQVLFTFDPNTGCTATPMYLHAILSSGCTPASGICGADGGDNLTWTFTCDSVLTISGSGAMADYNGSSYVPWHDYQASIRTAVIGSGVTNLSSSAFENCTALVSVDIPEGITSLGMYTFGDCSSLKTIDLPSTMTSLGSYCFANCWAVDSIICRATTPPAANGSTLSGLNYMISIYVPAGTVEAYRSADGWSGFTDYRELPCDTPIAFGTCGVEDNLTWEISCDSIFTLTGTGAMKDGDDDKWYSQRMAIKKVVIGDGITNLVSYAFRQAENIQEVIIGEGVTKIGNSAFWGCSGIRNFQFPSTLDTLEDQAFRSCAYIKSIILPASVKYIGTWAFAYCYIDIGSIVCHAATPPICGNEAFYEIRTSTPLHVPARSVSAYQAADVWNSFTNIIALPECVVDSGECGAQGDNVTWTLTCDSIMFIRGTGAMASFSTNSTGQAPWASYGPQIRDIVIEEGVTSIGAYAFYNAGSYTNGAYNNVRSVVIPSTVSTLSNNYFYQCPLLTVTINSDTIVGHASYSSGSSLHKIFGAQVRKYIIGDGVKSIANSAFHNQSADSLRSVVLPEGITSIGTWAFGYLENLDSIALPSTLQSIGSDAFYGSGLKHIEIPAGVTDMGGQAFQNCDKLTSLTLQEGLTVIGTSAFANCTAIQEITIPQSIETISSGAFSGCASLTKAIVLSPTWVGETKSSSFVTKQALGGYIRELVLGDNITTIGKYAFSSLDSLQKVTLPSTLISIVDYAFSSCPSLTSVTCEAYTPPTIASTSFSRQDTLFVRCETRQTYKDADYWKNFKKFKCFDGGDEYDEVTFNLTHAWTFVMLPTSFSMSAEDVVTEGDVEWGTYNGELRATGHSGWENYAAASVHSCSQALIVRAAGESAKLTISVPLQAQSMAVTSVPVSLHPSDMSNNANWCFVGNPYPYGYLLSGLAAQGIESPIHVWNGIGYDMHTPGIDDYIIPAFGAFFIQLPDDTSITSINFSVEYIYM